MANEKNNNPQHVDVGNEEQYMQAPGVTDDSIAEVGNAEMIENFENDVKAYETKLADTIKEKENEQIQFDIDCGIWDILSKPGAIRKKELSYPFEEDEKYWELTEKKQQFKIRQERALGEQRLKGYDHQIEVLTEALEKAKKKLAKFKDEE